MSLVGHEESDSTARQGTNRALSDRSLLGRIRRGQEDAATVLYMRYAERLRALAVAQCSPGLAKRVEPDDIVQSVFRTFFRRVTQGQYDVPAGEELWKLLLVMALNKIRAAGAFHRAAKRDVRLSVGGNKFDQAMEDRARPDEMALTVLRLVIEEVLACLPASNRQIVELRIEEYDVAEIAHKTKRSKRTVERVLQQFRQRLSAILHEGEDQ